MKSVSLPTQLTTIEALSSASSRRDGSRQDGPPSSDRQAALRSSSISGDWGKRYKVALEQLTTCVGDQNELRDADVQSTVEMEDLLHAGESTADGIKQLLTFAIKPPPEISAEKARLCAGRLVNRLLNESATRPHIAKGFSDCMTHAIEEDQMYLPNLWNWLGSILATALIYGSSPLDAPLSDFGETFEKSLHADRKYAEELLDQFLLAVVKQGGDTALVNLFAREASDEDRRRLDIYAPQLVVGSDAHSRFFDANPSWSAVKCLLDNCASSESDVESSSSTYKFQLRLLKLERRLQRHGNTEDSQRFIENETRFIDQHFTAEERCTEQFIRCLVRGICQTVLTGSETAQHHFSQDDESTADADDDGNQQVDEALFQERFKNLLIRYVDADSEGEDVKRLWMLDAFAEQVQNRGYPQGLIVEIFELLNMACVVSLDTCRTWRSRAQQRGLYAMILCDGGLMMMLLAEDEE